MHRETLLKQASSRESWDVIIVGGGATGLGCAVDSAARGYRTLLLEEYDFAKGTSSRSTKLIHGGLRYLQQGNIALVMEALRERGRLCQNAPHLIHHLPFFVPSYKWWEGPFYGIGVKMYDLLAGKLGIEPSLMLSREEALKRLPTLEPKDLRGGTLYYDGQFDDARLAITLMRTFLSLGGVALNYCPVLALIKEKGLVTGVKARCSESGEELTLKARVVIQATGVFSDALRKLDDPVSYSMICPSQGVHLVLDASFLESKSAILVPHTDDGRVIFLVPWLGRVLVGTTDTPIPKVSIEPVALEEEIQFLLKTASRYLARHPTQKDILSLFTGLRPLVCSSGGKKSSSLSRDHTILVSPSGLVTISGGKWTTYRKMAEDTVGKAAQVGGLPERRCTTAELRLQGFCTGLSPTDPWSSYGSELPELREMMESSPALAEPLHPRLPYKMVEVAWAVEKELAIHLEDVLARRTRALLLDAKASLEAAPQVARMMAQMLGKSSDWIEQELAQYQKLLTLYLPPCHAPSS